MTGRFRRGGAVALTAIAGWWAVAGPAVPSPADGMLTASAPPVASFDMVGSFRDALAEASAADPALSAFYATRDYQPIWTSVADGKRRDALFAALGTAGAEGLPVARYDAAGLRARLAAVGTERERGLLEARMSRIFLSYTRDLTSGALEPRRIDPSIVRSVPRPDRLALISAFAASGDPAGFLRSLEPGSPEYAALLKTRQNLAGVIRRGGWGASAMAVGTLRPGMSGPGVASLTARMHRMGYFSHRSAETYDGAVQRAVQAYQQDQGLSPDGVAGPATLKALNTSPEERMQSVVVAMERLRWMNLLDLGSRYLWVNIPDFHARIIDNGRVTFDSIVVVGQSRQERRTPEFSDTMRMLVVNPSWHVPRSITVKEYLPKLQQNPDAEQQINVVDSEGQVIPRDTIDFNAYTDQTFPFRLRQDPSPRNALGRVKFLFPNKWNIYLHDTPSKSLFAQPVRTFSHGCVRVARPYDLAYALLAPQVSDPQAYFQQLLDSGKETTIRLKQPLPVHLVYFTAWPGADGKTEYRNDVYGRDAALYAALAQAGVELIPRAD